MTMLLIGETYMANTYGPSTLPCGTPDVQSTGEDFWALQRTDAGWWQKTATNLVRYHGCQNHARCDPDDAVIDSIESSRNIQRQQDGRRTIARWHNYVINDFQ